VTRNHEWRDSRLYLKEIITYIDDIKDITEGLTYETFLQRKVNMHALNVRTENPDFLYLKSFHEFSLVLSQSLLQLLKCFHVNPPMTNHVYPF
jgi:hypothetical protein